MQVDFPCTCGHMKSEHAVDHKALGDYDFWIAKYGCRVEIPGAPGKCIDDCINFKPDNLKYLEQLSGQS